MKKLSVEIFAVGKWNGISVTQNMLVEMANNFTRLNDVVDVALKFGHNKEQKMTDGQPALGWVDKVWVEGNKLFAEFIDMPKIVHKAMKNKLYKNVSIEADFGVTHKGTEYGTVLTAVALLGADIPAVNTLSDLTTYMTAKNLAFASQATFSKKNINQSEDIPMGMSTTEQAEFDAMKAKVDAQDKALATATTDTAKFKKGEAENKAELDAMKASNDAAEFAREKTTIESDLEALVKDNKITPAQRDSMMKDFSAETKAQVLFSIDLFKENKPMESQSDQAHQNGADNDNDNLPADQRVSISAKKFAAENKVSFSAGVNHVMSTDPKLAREYADFNDLGEK